VRSVRVVVGAWRVGAGGAVAGELRADRRAATAEVFAAATRGELTAAVHEVLLLEHAVLAHREMQAGRCSPTARCRPGRCSAGSC
jgi:hypothetical protein